MGMNRLKHFYIEELKDLYSAETQMRQHLRQAFWGRPSNLAFEADPQGRKGDRRKADATAGSINLEAVESGESEAGSDWLRKAKTARA